MKDTIARKKAAFKQLCRFPSKENKTIYKCIKKSNKESCCWSYEKKSQTKIE